MIQKLKKHKKRKESHFRSKDTHKLKAFLANGNEKKAGVAILTSDKIDLKIDCNRYKEGHYMMIKE